MQSLNYRLKKLENQIVENSSEFILSRSEKIFRDDLKSSLLKFTQYFYKLRTNRNYVDWPAKSRKSMLSQLIPPLEATVFKKTPEEINPYLRQYFGVAPRTGKTELCLHYIAWAMANYPDSLFMYITYSSDLSRDNTKIIREIISIPEYRRLFGISIKSDSNKANHFVLNTGGEVRGLGSDGPITGKGAGIAGSNRFGGAIVMDDLHKPYEAMYSKASRDKVWNWYKSTASSRYNNPSMTPGILVAQRVHQDDIAGVFLGSDENGNNNDEYKWKNISLPMVDRAGNILRPDMFTKKQAAEKARIMPFEWSAQYLQDPTDDANSLYHKDDFPILDTMPEIEITFVTADTACQVNKWNDYTAFGFFGLYRRKIGDYKTDEWGIHVLNMHQERIKPENIQEALDSFFIGCMRFPVKPSIIVIELAGVAYAVSGNLKKKPGISVIDIQRSSSGTSKSQRFADIQCYIKSGMVTFQSGSKFNEMVINHMSKITPSDSHAHDDIADTIQMACEKSLDQKVIQKYIHSSKRKIASISNQIDASIW